MGALHAISACAYNTIFLYYPRVGRSWLLRKMMAMQRDRNCLNISRGASLRAAPASATQRETSMEKYQTSTLAEYMESIWFFVATSFESSSSSDTSSSNKKTWPQLAVCQESAHVCMCNDDSLCPRCSLASYSVCCASNRFRNTFIRIHVTSFKDRTSNPPPPPSDPPSLPQENGNIVRDSTEFPLSDPLEVP
jgi:hypothetical protein